MCGIVGIIAKRKFGFYAAQADLFTNMLRFDSIRGPDSTGVFGITGDGKVDLIKGDGDGHTFVSCSNYSKFKSRISTDYKIAIGHNRKATKGSISAKNAHPFQEKHIILVHNGTIWNQEDLNTEVEVDSHAIAHALSEHDCVTALGKINGAYALVWYDQKDKILSLARNDQRPLYIIEYEDYWIIASEAGLPLWLNGRDRISPVKEGIRLVPEEKMIAFNLKTLEDGPFEVAYEEYAQWVSLPPIVEPPKSRYYPSNNRQSSAALLGPPKQNLSEPLAFKAGDDITFHMTTYADETQEDQVVVGNPLFGDEIDTNIIIRWVLPKGQSVLDILQYGTKFFTAKVIAMNMRCSIPVVFVRDAKPLKIVKDMAGNEHKLEDLEFLLEGNPCKVCSDKVTIDEVPNSIVKEKGPNSYRVVCSDCLATSFKNAGSQQSQLHLVQ